jgi:hypothetical protein
MCPPNSICLHESSGEIHGRCLGGVLCCGQPSFWIQHPSSIETGPEKLGRRATKRACPSSSPAWDISIVNNPAAVELSV